MLLCSCMASPVLSAEAGGCELSLERFFFAATASMSPFFSVLDEPKMPRKSCETFSFVSGAAFTSSLAFGDRFATGKRFLRDAGNQGSRGIDRLLFQ